MQVEPRLALDDAPKGSYILLRFARDVGGGPRFHYGPDLYYSGGSMRQEALAIVVSELRNIRKLDSKSLAKAEHVSVEELYKIKRRHVFVDVVLLREDDSEVLKLIPLHAKHGWRFDVHAEEIQKFPMPATNEEFMKRLAQAFETAT